jgi:hypothetical protein
MDGDVYKVVATSAQGCDGDDSGTLTVYPNPTCNAYADNPLACEGAAIQLHVAGAGGNGGPYTYVWSGADASYFSSTTSADPTFNAPIGVYNLTVTVTETSTGCTSTCPVSVEVYDCVPDCETGFAVMTEDVGGYDTVDDGVSSCFRNDGFRRWGWTNSVNTSDLPLSFSLYAGAGRCDLSKGDYTGTVDVTYEDRTDDSQDNPLVYITYNMATDYVISEAHVYIGCDPYPSKSNSDEYTVAPGQYTYNAGDLGYIQNSFGTPGFIADGDFYFIAHAVVCETDIPDGLWLPGSPNEDGMFDVLDPNEPFTTTCDDNTGGWGRTADFTAYPVPFENEVNIGYKFEYDTDIRIDVYDIKGTLVRQVENNSYIKGTYDKTTIDLSRTDNQMYFVRLTTSEGTVVKKIISSSNLSRD